MNKAKKAKQYIKNGGDRCPHCGSTSIEGGHFEVNHAGAWQEIGCNECDREWMDIYTLTSVSLDDEDEDEADTQVEAAPSPQDHVREIDPAWGMMIVENYTSHAIEIVQKRLESDPHEYHSWRAHFMGASPQWMALNDGQVYDPQNDPNRHDK